MKENNKNLYFVIANEKNEAYVVLVQHTLYANKTKYRLSDSLNSTESFKYYSENKEDCQKYIDDNGFKRVDVPKIKFYKYDFDINTEHVQNDEVTVLRIMAYERYNDRDSNK